MDRYAYVNNNPLKYTDPTGHEICDEEGNCYNAQGWYRARYAKSLNTIDTWKMMIRAKYRVTFTGDDWTNTDMLAIYEGVKATGDRIASSIGGNKTSSEAFLSVFKTLNFEMWDGQCAEGCWGISLGAHNIRLYRHYTNGDYTLNTKISEQLVVHEMGHSFEEIVESTGSKAPNTSLSANMTKNRNGLSGPLWRWQQSDDITSEEIFADMFLGWVYNKWDITNYPIEAKNRYDHMDLNMPLWILKVIL